jgi:hypothetical protein
METTSRAATFRPVPRGRGSSRLAAWVILGASIGCALATPAFAEPATSCNLYASTGGSDSDSGTASAPLRTVKRLIGKLAAGQTGCLISGQTFAGFTLYAGDSHGAEGAPVTITSTNPAAPATIDTRVTTTSGADWLTFTHLILKSDVLSSTEDPSPTIASRHTSWTYDDISGSDTNICILPSQPTQYGAAEYTLVEHDRVHDCGHPVTAAELAAQGEDGNLYEGRLNGWHAHGVYDEGLHTTIKNSYFYDNSGKGILLRGGSYAVVEHNVVDHNGSGVLFGDDGPNHDVVAWNIVSNSTSPCGRETGWCDDFGVWSFCQESCGANSFVNNDVFGNQNGNIAPPYDLCSCIEVRNNIELDPLYVNAAAHEYTLQARSPAVGYGPDTAQPTGTSAPSGESPPAFREASPASTEASPSAPGEGLPAAGHASSRTTGAVTVTASTPGPGRRPYGQRHKKAKRAKHGRSSRGFAGAHERHTPGTSRRSHKSA